MRQFGLIGFPLSHSFSKRYFTEKFIAEGIDARYENYPLDHIGGLPAFINSHPLEGINVTIPHKQSVIPYLHSVSDVVREIGACNCVRIRNNMLEGFNTDVIGFDLSLSASLTSMHSKALVLGTGGAAKAVCYVLQQKGIAYTQVSRSARENTITYENITADLVKEHRLIINATSLGMFPDINGCPPIPYQAVTTDHYFFDLVYNPSVTMFLQNGADQGAVTENGADMLAIQADESWSIWNG